MLQVYNVNITERLTFDDAELYCTNMGANLVSIHSKDEEFYIYEKVV
jgi:hypothetical protein